MHLLLTSNIVKSRFHRNFRCRSLLVPFLSRVAGHVSAHLQVGEAGGSWSSPPPPRNKSSTHVVVSERGRSHRRTEAEEGRKKKKAQAREKGESLGPRRGCGGGCSRGWDRSRGGLKARLWRGRDKNTPTLLMPPHSHYHH